MVGRYWAGRQPVDFQRAVKSPCFGKVVRRRILIGRWIQAWDYPSEDYHSEDCPSAEACAPGAESAWAAPTCRISLVAEAGFFFLSLSPRLAGLALRTRHHQKQKQEWPLGKDLFDSEIEIHGCLLNFLPRHPRRAKTSIVSKTHEWKIRNTATAADLVTAISQRPSTSLRIKASGRLRVNPQYL